jgi:hypothetical protein
MEFSTAILLNHPSGQQVRVDKYGNFCLTDMAAIFPNKDIKDWIYNKSTFEFINVWEKRNNPNWINSNWGEIPLIKNSALTFKKLAQMNAISITSKTGRYGGTYAHKHIAFEFAMWLSPEFKLWVIEEFDRLSSMKHNWDFNRYLSKQGYKIQTAAIKEQLEKNRDEPIKRNIYSEEADVLNLVVFGKPANGKNQRDTATKEQLQLIGELEVKNGNLIEAEVPRAKRYEILLSHANKFRTRLLTT